MGTVLGALRRKKVWQAEAGPLPTLLCTDDGVVGNTATLGRTGLCRIREETAERGQVEQSQLWLAG